jgi:hypothetical protein
MTAIARTIAALPVVRLHPRLRACAAYAPWFALGLLLGAAIDLTVRIAA